MHRFYLPSAATQNPPLVLSGAEAHHAIHVLRVRRGDEAVVFDGTGSELRVVVIASDRHTVTLDVLESSRHSPAPYEIILIQGVVKGKAMDLIVQKATELGIHRLIPVITRRCVVRVEGSDAEEKAARWRATAVEAMKQCGALWLPTIEAPVGLDQFLRTSPSFDLSLVGSLGEERAHPRDCFSRFIADHRRPPNTLAAWVGPEGDFTPDELQEIIRCGALPVSLGPQILRSETAALAFVTILNYEMGFALGLPGKAKAKRASPESAAE